MDIRPAAPSDADGMIRLLKERFGESYVDRRMYDAGYIAEGLRLGRLRAAVAEDGGVLAGMVAVKDCEVFEGTAMFTMWTVSDKARASGVGAGVFDALCGLGYGEYDCVYAHMLAFTAGPQAVPERNGFVPTGFAPEAFKTDGWRFDGVAWLPERTLQLNMTRKAAKTEVGRLHVPEEVRGFVSDIYARLGCRVTDAPAVCSGGGLREFRHDAHGYAEYIGGLPSGLAPGGWVTVFLDMLRDDCAGLYNEAKARGFVFTGVQPLAGGEYLIMHRSPSLARTITAIERSMVVGSFEEGKRFILEMAKEGHIGE